MDRTFVTARRLPIVAMCGTSKGQGEGGEPSGATIVLVELDLGQLQLKLVVRERVGERVARYKAERAIVESAHRWRRVK